MTYEVLTNDFKNIKERKVEFLSDFKLVFELAGLIGTAVWAVSKIQATTKQLASSMEHLTKSVDKLDSRMENVRSDLWNMNSRISRLEAVLEVGDSRARVKMRQVEREVSNDNLD